MVYTSDPFYPVEVEKSDWSPNPGCWYWKRCARFSDPDEAKQFVERESRLFESMLEPSSFTALRLDVEIGGQWHTIQCLPRFSHDGEGNQTEHRFWREHVRNASYMLNTPLIPL